MPNSHGSDGSKKQNHIIKHQHQNATNAYTPNEGTGLKGAVDKQELFNHGTNKQMCQDDVLNISAADATKTV